jgi:hypothetical protein
MKIQNDNHSVLKLDSKKDSTNFHKAKIQHLIQGVIYG